jgi:hypothetical protein
MAAVAIGDARTNCASSVSSERRSALIWRLITVIGAAAKPRMLINPAVVTELKAICRLFRE